MKAITDKIKFIYLILFSYIAGELRHRYILWYYL